MRQPLIGVTTWRKRDPENYLSNTLAEAYAQALSQAGAAPLLIPAGMPLQALDSLLEQLHGLLLSGGGDIAPEFYAAGLDERINGVDAARDELELSLFQAALEREMPVLGICRGLQLFNVALGGTLYADIASQKPQAIKHDYTGQPRHYLAHDVELRSGSRLAAILDHAQLPVNSLHHQGIAHLATGLEAVALAPDGLVEAVEIPAHPFALAVQWHPECLLDHPPMQALFKSFVAAAARGGY
jgi:putative glutamine amidotransferase